MRSPDENASAPVRVLHIGNIANNAYLNAAMLNRAGYDCDVLVSNYYHIMGCPEWEDSDFHGDVDEFSPDWDRVNLGGFRRPRWFAQGPTLICLRYLLARRRGATLESWWWWTWLGVARRTASLPRYRRLKNLMKLGLSLAHAARIKALRVAQLGRGVLGRAVQIARRAAHLPSRIANILRRPATLILYIPPSAPVASQTEHPVPGAAPATGLPQSPAPGSGPSDARLAELVERFVAEFPDRPDQLSIADFSHYLGFLPLFRELFASYDVIHCYGTDPVWPLLAGNMPYVAFEHGTIRHIPFQNNAVGRLTALAYNQADRVIVTNCDCHLAAQRLKCKHYEFVPHPLNERWIEVGMGRTLRRSLLAELDADFLCFHPPRQHWIPWRELVANGSSEDPSWFKANDVFYEGFARFMREVAPRAAIIAVEWGATVDKSKALLAELGVDRVKWIAPQHSRNMLRYADACDVLVDQFWVGAFGTTMPKGMPLANPAMSYVDPTLHSWCMAELPPILNARNPDEVFALLKRGYEDREWLADIGRRGRDWYQRHHSNATIIAALGRLYREAIAEHSAIVPQPFPCSAKS